MPLQDHFNKNRRKNYNSKEIVVDEITFYSIAAASEFYGVKRATVQARLKSGWTSEEALEIVEKSGDHCQGEIYKISNTKNKKVYIGLTTIGHKTRWRMHLKDAQTPTCKLHCAIKKIGAEHFSVKVIAQTQSRQELRCLEMKFIDKYNSVKDGYNQIYGGGHLGFRIGTAIEYNGVLYPSKTELAKMLGISGDTINYRIERGIALDLPDRRGRHGLKVEYAGKVFNTIEDLAQYLKINTVVVRYRLERGLDPVNPKRLDKPILYKGVTYRSKGHMAKELGLSRNIIHYRVNNNIPIQGTDIAVYVGGK